MFGLRRIRPGLGDSVVRDPALAAGCQTTSRFEPPADRRRRGASVAAPVKGARRDFAFAPIEGVPVPILQAMSDAAQPGAGSKRLNVVPTSDPSAVYTVRGYLSAWPRARTPSSSMSGTSSTGKAPASIALPARKSAARSETTTRGPGSAWPTSTMPRAKPRRFAGRLGEVAPRPSRRLHCAGALVTYRRPRKRRVPPPRQSHLRA